jgi:hypothetical protein
LKNSDCASSVGCPAARPRTEHGDEAGPIAIPDLAAPAQSIRSQTRATGPTGQSCECDEQHDETYVLMPW